MANLALTTKSGKKDGALTPKKLKAIEHLTFGHTQKETADKVGVSQTTIARWMKDDLEFSKELARSVELYHNSFKNKLYTVANDAVVFIHRVIRDETLDVDTRLEASKHGLNGAVRLATQYHKVQHEGLVPPQPLIVFPPNTRLPWTQKPLSPGDDVIEAEATVVEEDDAE